MSNLWFTASGRSFTFEEVVKTSKEYAQKNGTIFIGSDSFLTKQKCVFASTVCLHGADNTYGGKYFFKKETFGARRFKNLRQRIFQEVQCSIDLALQMQKYGIARLELHIDVSPSENHTRTSPMSDSLMGYVRGIGFDCKIKPYAWAAATVADKHSK